MLLPRKVSRVDRFVLCSLPTCSQLPTPSFCSRTGGANVGISGLFLFLSHASTLATRQLNAKNIERRWRVMEDEGETTSTSRLSRAWRGTRDGKEFDLQE